MSVKETAISNAESRIESTVDQVNNELRNMRQICNAVNYNIVQEYDISSQEFTRQFSMLYETNTDKIQSLALYGDDGMLIESEPVATVKDNVKVAEDPEVMNLICLLYFLPSSLYSPLRSYPMPV